MVAGKVYRRLPGGRRVTTRRRGAAVVEMAVVTPLLLALMFGIMEFGWVFMVTENLTNSAREVARVAVLQGSTTADVQQRLVDSIGPTGLTLSDVSFTVDPPMGTTPTNGVVTVSIRVPYARVSLVGNYLGLNISRTLGASCSMRKEGSI